jgi:hypothetical protein
MRKSCRVRDCETERYGRLSLCRLHHREKKRRQISKAWSRRHQTGQKRCVSYTASDLKIEAVAAYGGSCVGCGDETAAQLQLDHIYNNGQSHRASISRGRAGADFYRALKKKGWPNKEPYVMELRCYDCHLTVTQKRRYED